MNGSWEPKLHAIFVETDPPPNCRINFMKLSERAKGEAFGGAILKNGHGHRDATRIVAQRV